MGSLLSALSSPAELKTELLFPKVELHLHLDGSVRHKTLLELSLEKEIDMNGAKTVDDVRKICITKEPASLSKLLTAFDIFLPVIAGDKDAIERIAYELCEDQAAIGVIYFEARYSPHLLCNTVKNSASKRPGGAYSKKGKVYPKDVVEAVKRGFDRGEKAFNIKARSIICCICGYAEWNHEVVELAGLSSLGVVAIDVAGCSQGADEQYEPSVMEAFKEAAKRGIHRTVHAGESGGPKEVIHAINEMKAERIGHGYRLLRDEQAYKKYAIEGRVHLEACPQSSIMTGSVPLDWPNHPVKRWAKDGVNFSINTDDPTCLDNNVYEELLLAHDLIGLTKMQLWQCQLNGAHSCFATEDEKRELITRIEAAKPTA